ncbi:glucosamine-6-phosphate deaminase [Corynebacterium yudongzhengii]|uniref:Glucosamine-6-phosphate deaminase n=1 Tax=Corynebacterium yudongzhengii TaxID=2080740 RepID=A0A2U1T5Y8_9CORY|nr:glucosamine-6-phosphate deaminase [Corynebacterium yudongzhengii]AWB82622.1 glucosamine-6-phosphate deaminase [Corynebacterium yudongzhengii]PWC01414.1 glucosamine-6-phosphate deaminase [Corynebacterium yudongzhengii]
MDILIRDTPDQVAQTAADIVEIYVRRGQTIGLATGSTPLGLYRELIRRHREEHLSFAGIDAFCLDEYIGLPADHEQSYHRFIRDNFTSQVDFADERVHSPDGMDPRPWVAAELYEKHIRDVGGISVQVLGVGTNGHIGFNEPASPLRARTRVETLHQQTLSDNARFFSSPEEVPTHAITQGLGTILDARHPLLLATGEGKANAIAAMVEGPLSASCPASVLQLHDQVTVVVDKPAASQLADIDYYRHMESARPEWMGLDGLPVD